MKNENWNMFKLKNKANSEKFIKYLEVKKKEENFEDILRMIKISEVFISSSYKKSNVNQVGRIANFLISNYYATNANELALFFKEVDYLIEIKENAFGKVENVYNLLPESKQFAGIVIVLSNMLANRFNYSDKNKFNYSYQSDYLEALVKCSGMIIKDMLRRKFPFEINELTESEIQKVSKHFEVGSELTLAFEIIDAWIYGNIDIEVDGVNSGLIIKETGEFNKRKLMCQMPFLELKGARSLFSSMFSFGDVDRFIENNRRCVEKNISEYFYTDDFSQLYMNIELKEWIDAYWCLFELVVKPIFSNDETPTFISYSKKSIISMFEQKNMSTLTAEKIFSKMLFSKQSIDLYDSPLIETEKDSIIIIPHLILAIDISRSLLSIFGSKNDNIDSEIYKKGENFERYVQSLIEIQFPKTVTNEKRNRDGDYELDLAFNIGNDVYLVEAKTQKQPGDYKDFQRNQEELEEYLKKFTRNAKYFINNESEFLCQEFELEVIDRFFMIFVSNVYQPQNRKNGIYLIDEIDLYNFMKRNPPMQHFFEGKRNKISSHPIDKELYTGVPTTNQFIQLITNPKRNSRLLKQIGLREINLMDQQNLKMFFLSIKESVVSFGKS